MCGIWAFISENNVYNGNLLLNLKEVFQKIKNRGPDYSSFQQILDNVFIGFHRLSIMDLTVEGNQPFTKIQKDGTILYSVTNGEIYNYEGLLKKHGISIKSHSDCEVVLPLYQKLGLDFITELGSEFATVLIEISNEKSKMIVARDPIGVRPLFYSLDNGLMVSSEVKGILKNYNVNVFPPGHYAIYENQKFLLHQYHHFIYKTLPDSMEQAQINIKEMLISSVKERLMSDRKFGCLLSGGLDSSLIVGIVRYLMPDVKFPVFTISFRSGSTDLPYAKLMAEKLNLDHFVVEIDETTALNEIEETIYTIESYDITTVRASVLQRILAKYISEHTDIKVLLVGENSDELFAGYLYEHNAPSANALHEDTIRLVKDVHMFDGLRTDRTMAYHGLEVRLPFADVKLVDYVFQLDPNYTVPNGDDNEKNKIENAAKIEKYLLRKAFSGSGIIPDEIIWRQKEAFSDGVSKVEKSWFQYIEEHVENLVSNEEFNGSDLPSKEAYYYKKIFQQHFGHKFNVIPYYWMPKWQKEINNPSARVLKVYQ
jgi:asparagine synthase (glutamine-hydrolysing)